MAEPNDVRPALHLYCTPPTTMQLALTPVCTHVLPSQQSDDAVHFSSSLRQMPPAGLGMNSAVFAREGVLVAAMAPVAATDPSAAKKIKVE